MNLQRALVQLPRRARPLHPPPDDGQGTLTSTIDAVAPHELVHQMVSQRLVDIAPGLSGN